jgi:hypothetical protein
LIEFFDTSVLIAAGQTTHVHHQQSFARLAAAKKAHSACAVHTLAEVYASMTAIPLRPRILPGEIFDFHLSSPGPPPAYHPASRGISECSAYTWNLKHFRAIAPHLAERIQNP